MSLDDDIEFGGMGADEPDSAPPAPGHTFDQDRAADAVRRLRNFIANAKIKAEARVLIEDGGLCAGVVDRGMVAPYDFDVLPKTIKGLLVKVVTA